MSLPSLLINLMSLMSLTKMIDPKLLNGSVNATLHFVYFVYILTLFDYSR